MGHRDRVREAARQIRDQEVDLRAQGREVGHQSNPQVGGLVAEEAAVSAAEVAGVPGQMPRNMPEEVEAVVHQVAVGAVEVCREEAERVVHYNIDNINVNSIIIFRTVRTTGQYSTKNRVVADLRN